MTGERGSVLVTAIAVLFCMITIGLASLSIVDVQTRESAVQRHRASSLQLSEGVLYAQAFVLARNWPGSPARAYPQSCSSDWASTVQCPDRNTLAAANSETTGSANFSGGDYGAAADGDPRWTTRVRDNGGTMGRFYRPEDADAAQAGCPLAPCTIDANGDRRVWVQIDTRVRGRPRSIVALLQLELFHEAFPRSAVTAGRVTITNSGNHGGRALVDVAGSQIAVRCEPPSGDGGGNDCVDFARASQIVPRSFVQLPASQPPALSPSALERLRDVAETNGTLFDGCPPNNANLAGAVVFVENCPSASYGSSLQTVACPSGYDGLSRNGGCINTPASPGILIWKDGTLEFRGNATFVGLVYAVNASGLGGDLDDPPVLEVGGGFQIYGAASIDGPGELAIGSNAGPNVKFHPNVFNALRSFGTAGLVQNTWRELPAQP